MDYVGTQSIALDRLLRFPGNARRGDVDVIRASVRRHGQYRALVVRAHDDRLTVLAGNHTLDALTAEGYDAARCEILTCDDAEATRINLADNRMAEIGSIDNDALAGLLTSLAGDLDGTGFTDADLAALLVAPADGEVDRDTEPAAPPTDPLTRPGDMYALGPHRIICGDCRDHETVARLLDGRRINVAFTSPPYAMQRSYDETSGFRPIPPSEYVDWFRDVAANVRAHIADDGSWFVNIKPSVTADGLDTDLYVFDLVLAHVRAWAWHFATEYCWQRNGVPKNVTRRFKNQFEPVYQFTAGDWKMRPDAVRHASDHVPTAGGPGVGNTSWSGAQGGNGPMFGAAKKRKNGTADSDVMAGHMGSSRQPGEYIGPGLAYPGNRLPTFTATHDATGHTAAFPVGLPAWFIRAYTDPGDVIFDPFMGSGSTLIAAHNENRVGYGCEISPAYVDVICRRWQEHAADKPLRILADDGTEPVDFTAVDTAQGAPR